MLFGDQDREEYRSRFENIKTGDGAFLYNLDKERLYGFYIIREKGRNLEPQKWGGRFPLQVRVELQTHYQLTCRLTRKELFKVAQINYFIDPLSHDAIERILNLLKAAPLGDAPQPTRVIARKYPEGFYKAEDGHLVRSIVEREIDDFLYRRGILHAYEKLIPGEKEFYCDFYLPQYNLWIEFWGREGDPEYERRKREKLSQYRCKGLKLFEIHKEDVPKLKDILSKLLEDLNKLR